MQAKRLSYREDYAAVLAQYDTWLFDCDGVLWNGEKLVDGAVEVLEMLRRRSTSQLLKVFLNDAQSR